MEEVITDASRASSGKFLNNLAHIVDLAIKTLLFLKSFRFEFGSISFEFETGHTRTYKKS